jgi:hypothetical protein
MDARSSAAPAITLVAILATTGCDAVLTSTQLPSVREDGILGEWKDLGKPGSKPDPEPILFKFKDGDYWAGSAAQFAKGEASQFTLARAGDVLIAQSPGKDQCDEFNKEKGQPCWSLNRLELVGKDRMYSYEFDAQRVGKDSFSGALNVVHAVHRKRNKDGKFDTAILFSAESSEWARFLESYVKHPGVLRLTGRLQRAH